MRVGWHRANLSVAALLLCLMTALAVAPSDYFRAQSPTRSRGSRTVGFDDHDHDHVPDAESLCCDLSDGHYGDGPELVALLPVISGLAPSLEASEGPEPHRVSVPPQRLAPPGRCRAPPAL
jgi:hypothetical protein